MDLDDLRARNSIAAQLARMTGEDDASRRGRKTRAVPSLVGAGALLVSVTWYGTSEVLSPPRPLQQASTAAAQIAPIGVAAAAGLPASGPLPPQSHLQADPQGVHPRVDAAVSLAGQGSAARRDCMAQVETAVLFQLMAKDAVTRGAYNVAVNREIKRLLGRHEVKEPHTLDLIAAQSWAGRSQLSAPPGWWTSQYQRCERRRLQGARYMVRAD